MNDCNLCCKTPCTCIEFDYEFGDEASIERGRELRRTAEHKAERAAEDRRQRDPCEAVPGPGRSDQRILEVVFPE